jgi:hypothetical protein
MYARPGFYILLTATNLLSGLDLALTRPRYPHKPRFTYLGHTLLVSYIRMMTKQINTPKMLIFGLKCDFSAKISHVRTRRVTRG